MRIFYYCPEYFSNHGARTHAREFFRALSSNPRVRATEVWGGQSDSEPVAKGSTPAKPAPTAARLYIDRWRRIARFLRPKVTLTNQLIDKARQFQCDVIILRTGVRNLQLRRIRRALPGVKLCLEINSAYFDEAHSDLWLSPMLQRLEVGYFQTADCVSVVSSYLRDYLIKRGFPPGKILVNQNGVDADFAKSHATNDTVEAMLAQIPKDAFVLGYIGGMERFRKLPLLVRHVANLRRAGFVRLFLLIIGDGKDAVAVQQEITANGNDLAGSIGCVGWQPHSVIPRFMARIDAAVFPYTNPYCSPLKLFEYLGAGLPTIGPDVPAVQEVFRHGDHLLLAKQDGSDFEKHVVALYQSASLRQDLAQKGQKYVLSNYTWTHNVDRLLAHIESHQPTLRHLP